MRAKSVLFLLFITSFLSLARAYERADAFIVKMFDDRVKVLAPKEKGPNIHVIIENKTLSDVLGRIENTNGKYKKYVKVHAGKVESLRLEHNTTGSIFFVPMAPAFQEVELKWGEKAYEIPPQK